MSYDDHSVVHFLQASHGSDLLSDREKQLVGPAVTITRGCQVCTRNRIVKARDAGISDEVLNALFGVVAAVNAGVAAATVPKDIAWRSVGPIAVHGCLLGITSISRRSYWLRERFERLIAQSGDMSLCPTGERLRHYSRAIPAAGGTIRDSQPLPAHRRAAYRRRFRSPGQHH